VSVYKISMKRFEEVDISLNSTMFVLYNDVIFVKKDKTAVKKFAFQNDDTWLLLIHHQQSPLLSNSHKQSPVIDISRLTVVSREAKKGQSDRQKTKRATNYCVSFT